ncbi:hypothetical protein TRAPUB_5336 [Trametes pubescens]|uniref:F-box domain-containing protein n=1 Tax=Trametes pubescens TaxID=154538 RepID=A0A1M2V908_TRAPU|nr:hypothetical protein TRAPUB_5336 [Trametes pubescens]
MDQELNLQAANAMSDAYPPIHPPSTRIPPTPIDQLPNEILMEIFRAFWDLRLETFLWGHQPGSLAVLPLCAVSRRWREVAFAVPELWSYVRVNAPDDIEWMQLARTRSRRHPITLSVVIPDEFAFAEVLPELEGCRALICDLTISLAEDEDAASEIGVLLAGMTMNFLNAGMPALVALAVSIPDWPDLEPPGALLTLDAPQFPRLRALEVCRLQLSWMPDIFARLRRLSTGDCRGDEILSPSEFLDVLAISQQLEDVSMKEGMPFHDHAEVIAWNKMDRPLEIANLRKLEIHDDGWLILALLQRVRLPVGIHAEFRVYVSGQWDDKVSGLLQMSIPDDPTNVHFLETTTSADIVVPVDGHHEEHAHLDCDNADTGRFHIILAFFAYEQPPFMRAQCILEDFRTLFRRAPLRQLSITCDLIRIPHDLWVEVFRTFPSLCELHLSGEGYPGRLLAALAARPEEGSASEPLPPPLILPNLNTFTFKDFSWHRDLFGAIVRTFEGRAVAGASRMREVHVELRGREKNSDLNSMLRLDLATLRQHCDVVVYTDAE